MDGRAALDWTERRWKTVSLRANGAGAFFAVLAADAPDRALAVSPVLDMEGLILAMMGWAGAPADEFQAKGEIAASFGQTLSWKRLCRVREHPAHHLICPVSGGAGTI